MRSSLDLDRLPSARSVQHAVQAQTSEAPPRRPTTSPLPLCAMIVRAILLAGFAAMAAADLEADVRAFYHEHDASKLHKVSTVLFRYKGK